MNLLIDNGQLGTDLDGQGFDLLNIADLIPLPASIASSADPRLSDPRPPLAGSVTDASVSPTAGIQQGKLALNGTIPTGWLGVNSNQAAQGDLAEYKIDKGQPGGYASLDGSGRVPAAQMPVGAGFGTVTSVGLIMPAQFSLSGTPVVGAGNLTVTWASAPTASWFGNPGVTFAPPDFHTSPIPPQLVPPLDASIIATGTIAAARLPLAVGLGPTSSPGVVPDPGPGTAPGVLASDYLARDMTYKAIPIVPASYRPTLPALLISNSDNLTGPQFVTPSPVVAGAPVTIFYSLASATGPFTQFGLRPDPSSSGSVSVPPLATVWFYSSAAGYTDSAIQSYTNPNTV